MSLTNLSYPVRAALLAALLGFTLTFVTTVGDEAVPFLTERGSGEISFSGLSLFLARLSGLFWIATPRW